MLANTFPHHQADELRLIDLQEVRRLTSLSRSQIYSLMQRGQFPSGVKIGRSARWVQPEVNTWISMQIAVGRCK